MIKCSRCGFENTSNDKYCAKCGNLLYAAPPVMPYTMPVAPPPAPFFCGKCGTQAKPGDRFCAKCGAAVSGTPQPAQQPYPPAFQDPFQGYPSYPQYQQPPQYYTPQYPAQPYTFPVDKNPNPSRVQFNVIIALIALIALALCLLFTSFDITDLQELKQKAAGSGFETMRLIDNTLLLINLQLIFCIVTLTFSVLFLTAAIRARTGEKLDYPQQIKRAKLMFVASLVFMLFVIITMFVNIALLGYMSDLSDKLYNYTLERNSVGVTLILVAFLVLSIISLLKSVSYRNTLIEDYARETTLKARTENAEKPDIR